MTVDRRALAQVARVVANCDADDETQVQQFVEKTLPRLPASLRGLIFDFLVSADRAPTPAQIETLTRAIAQQQEMERSRRSAVGAAAGAGGTLPPDRIGRPS
jgi:hypothetical protein